MTANSDICSSDSLFRSRRGIFFALQIALSQGVAALLGDAGRVAAKSRVVGDEEPRALAGDARVQRTRRPTAWRKKSSVVVVVAYTPTRRRGMSTPSETIRTATSHGSRRRGEAGDLGRGAAGRRR